MLFVTRFSIAAFAVFAVAEASQNSVNVIANVGSAATVEENKILQDGSSPSLPPASSKPAGRGFRVILPVLSALIAFALLGTYLLKPFAKVRSSESSQQDRSQSVDKKT